MTKIISENELDRIRNISENKDLISLYYLKDITNKLTKFIYENFFNWKTNNYELLIEAKNKLEVLNQTIALPYKLATVKAKYVWTPTSNIKIKNLNEAVFSFVYWWVMIFTIDEMDENWIPKINIYNAEQYINQWDTEKILTFLKDDNLQKYIFVKEFKKSEWIIENKLYKIWNWASWLNWTEISLDKLSTTWVFEEIDDFDTSLPLIFTEHDFKIKDEIYWTPSLDFIKPMIKSIDIELVNIKDQFLKHLQAKMAIQWIDASQMPKDEDWNILMREAEAIFLQNWVNKPEYISNKNEMITDVIKILDKYITVATTNLSVPLELVWLSWQIWTESTESKLLRYSDFIKDIEYIRWKITEIYKWIYETIKDIYPEYFEWEDEFICRWGKVMPQDWLKLAQELNIAKMWGFISQKTAVKDYTWLNWEELEEELKQIKIEEAQSLWNTSLI